jgi:flagellar biosynthesis protein FlhF
MEIHTFRAASLQEALMLVRSQLGSDASILQTRDVAPRLFGMWGKRAVEVDATRDAHVIRRLAPEATPDATYALTSRAAGTGTVAGPAGHPHQAAGYSGSSAFDLTESDAAVLDATAPDAYRPENFYPDGTYPDYPDYPDGTYPDGTSRASAHTGPAHARTGASTVTGAAAISAAPTSAAVRGAAPATSAATGAASSVEQWPVTAPAGKHSRRHPRPGASPGQTYPLSPAMFEVFTELLDSDIDPEAARLMLQQVAAQCTPEQLEDAWLIQGRLCQAIQQQIEVSGPIMPAGAGVPHTVALIGPTGVGKTTTLAKLAASFHFEHGLQVGFLTLDTFRLGAVDQLRQYADLLAAPLEVVSAADQLRPALDRLRHCGLVLVDTAGRSPRDAEQLDVLQDFLRVAAPDEIHLVLSAASSRGHAEMALEQFAALQPTHLLLSKLDESAGLGGWYPLLTRTPWPLSYLTTGQHVPEDLVVANRRRVASMILGQPAS